MNELQLFNFEEQEVRVVKKGEDVWFVAKDISDVLGFKDSYQMSRILDEDEKDSYPSQYEGQVRNLVIISESGLYSAILRSKKPEAKQFKKWVTSEVLPNIRKFGMYMTDNLLEKTLADPNFMIGLLTNYNEEKQKRAALEAQNKQLSEKIIEAKPKLDIYDAWLDASGHCSIGEFGKKIGIGRNTLFEKLRQMKILMSSGVRKNLPYERFMKYFKVIDDVKNERPVRITLLNKEGCVWLHNKLKKEKEKLETLEVDYVADQKIGLN